MEKGKSIDKGGFERKIIKKKEMEMKRIKNERKEV